MSDARYESELVHVWRHGFAPSQPFEEAIQYLIKPGKTLPRFLLSGTKEIGVESLAYNDFSYKDTENELIESLRKYTQPIYIDSRMRAGPSPIGANALRLAFLPTEASEAVFNQVLTEFNRRPNIVPPPMLPESKQAPRFFMYIDIPATHLVDNNELGFRYRKLQSTLASKALQSMHYVHSEGVIGHDTMRILDADQVFERNSRRLAAEGSFEEAS